MSGPRSNGNAGEAESSNLPILTRFWNPGSPGFPRYARILRKRFPTVLIVFSILFSIALIATLKTETCVPAPRCCWRFKRKSRHSTIFRNSNELDSVSDAYLRSQYTILASESLARSVIDQHRLDTIGEFQCSEWWSWRWHKKKNTGGSQVFAAGPARADREVYQRVLERFEKPAAN